MARRTTSMTKGKAAARKPAQLELSEEKPAKAPRRGKKAEALETPAAAMSDIDALPTIQDDIEVGATDTASSEPPKARRGRKPKALPTAASPDAEADDETAIGSATSDRSTDADDVVAEDATASDDMPPSEPPREVHHDEAQAQPAMNTAAAPTAAAARWDNATGTATFDWPSIEAVAAAAGPNQTMAKLLLAARAEGANSRWPF